MKRLRRDSRFCILVLLITGLPFLWSGCAPASRDVSIARHARAEELVAAGVLWMRSGSLERARASFALAYEMAALPAALDGLGCVALLEGDAAQAEAYFVRALSSEPPYNTALGNLALLRESEGRLAEARALYRQALEHTPENFRLRNNFAAMLAGSGGRGDGDGRARWELLKALSLESHPLIEDNFKKVDAP